MSTRLLHGDCRDMLPTLAAGSVQCVVSSPPYFGLRDFGTATWDGGDADCDHADTSYGKGRGSGVWFDGGKPRELAGCRPQAGRSCTRCGARRTDAQIGLEATVEEYVATMVAVFREVKRVLRPDGTLWLNLGDGMRDKQLLGMPWRVAFALQADGWWLRSAIVWAKPNPIPESVTDRPTSSYEMVFLLSKRATYFYDADAVREDAEYGYQHNHTAWISGGQNGDGHRSGGHGTAERNPSSGRNARNVWTIATAPFPQAHFATFPPELAERCIKAGCKPGDTVLDPFLGAGTTALAADRLGRHCVGIELSPAYAAMARERIVADCPLFAQVSEASVACEARGACEAAD